MRVTLKDERPFDFPLERKVDLDKWNADAERAIEGTSEFLQHTLHVVHS